MRLEKEFIFEENDVLIKKAYQKAEVALMADAIDMNDFNSPYGEQQIERDKKEAHELKQRLRAKYTAEMKNNLEWSTVLEAILYTHSEQSDWLGKDVRTMKTTEYDDVFNASDMVVEFEQKEIKLLALAIDATFSHETKDKLKKIKREIDHGNLATIKYFKSERLGFKGVKNKIPHVIVGADRNTIVRLTESWLTGKNNELAIDPVQFQILEEILMQCKVFSAYARKIGKEEISTVYDNTASVINETLIQKEDSGLKDKHQRDTVFGALFSELQTFDQL